MVNIRPVVTNAGGSYHQGFVFGGNLNVVLIMTHAKELELAYGGTAEGKKIYTQYKEQRFYFSFIDQENTEIKINHKISVFGKNAFYDFGEYVGFTLRSALSKHC
jgi:hypothetical protein